MLAVKVEQNTSSMQILAVMEWGCTHFQVGLPESHPGVSVGDSQNKTCQRQGLLLQFRVLKHICQQSLQAGQNAFLHYTSGLGSRRSPSIQKG